MLTLDPAPLSPLAPGTELLEGRLVIDRLLGAGSMGVVYSADDRRLGRRVAVKTLANLDADRLYHLKREFRTIAGVRHANLVRLYELRTSGALWLLIMELVEGQELQQWLRLGPSRDKLLGTFGTLAEGLRLLHASGLRHGDVKPSNVMVTASDEAVLLDFGLAADTRVPSTTMAEGTMRYVAPEQLWNESPGSAADCFSFGVMLFEALTGAHPSAGRPLLRALREGPRHRPRELNPDVPTTIDDVVVRLLDPDPARRPDAAALATILSPPKTGAIGVPALAVPPFVGRDEILFRLHATFAEVAHGQVRLVHVHGPSGIGKTTLARRFLTEVRAPGGVVVIEGACHPEESVPFKALDTIVDNLTRHLLGLPRQTVGEFVPNHVSALLRLFPVLGRVPAMREWLSTPVPELSPTELRRLGFEALRELIRRLSERQPLVIWIDDIQWSDRDSGVLLQAMLAPPDQPRLFVLVTSRDEAVDVPLLDTLSGSVVPVDVPLQPLTSEESHRLASQLLRGAAAGITPDSVVDEAGGSPFLVCELVHLLRDRREGDRPARVDVADIVRLRLDNLPHDARRLLDTVAVAGRPLDADMATQASGLGGAGILLAYAMCAESLLRVTTADERVFFQAYHDRLRESAVADMSPETRRTRHRDLAQAIRTSRTPDARTLVQHYLAAQDYPDAVAYAGIAAEDAEQDLAFDQAAELYAVLLAHKPGATTDRAVLLRRANALANAARRIDAGGAYEDVARLATEDQPDTRTTLRVQAAEQFLYGGHLKRGLAILNAVLADVGVWIPKRPLTRSLAGLWLRARFVVRGTHVAPRESIVGTDQARRLDALWRATRSTVMLDHLLADVLAGTHLLRSLRLGQPSRALRAIALEAAFEANVGGRWFRGRSRRLLRDAEALAQRHGDTYDEAWLAHCRAACAWFDGEWRACVDLGGRAEHLFTAAGAGVHWDMAVLQGFRLSALANLGRLPELARKVGELVTDAERRQDRYSLSVFRTGDAVLIWLAEDDPGTALRIADESLTDYDPGTFTSQHRHHLVATVQSHLYAGHAESAWRAVERAWVPLRWSGFLFLDCLGTQLRYLRACAALALARTSSPPNAASLVATASREAHRIERSALPMAAPMAHAIAAAVAAAQGRRAARLSLLEQAAQRFAAADMALHAAACRLHLNSMLPGAAGRDESAAAWMQQQGIVRPESMARALVPS